MAPLFVDTDNRIDSPYVRIKRCDLGRNSVVYSPPRYPRLPTVGKGREMATDGWINKAMPGGCSPNPSPLPAHNRDGSKKRRPDGADGETNDNVPCLASGHAWLGNELRG